MFADLVFTDGNILTMNSVQPSAEAVAIKNDRIIKVGTNKEVSSFIGKETEVINLQGK
ncbi:MAG: amidohydrolase, partial [Candidatus Bathyarchaeum sp.]